MGINLTTNAQKDVIPVPVASFRISEVDLDLHGSVLWETYWIRIRIQEEKTRRQNKPTNVLKC